MTSSEWLGQKTVQWLVPNKKLNLNILFIKLCIKIYSKCKQSFWIICLFNELKSQTNQMLLSILIITQDVIIIGTIKKLSQTKEAIIGGREDQHGSNLTDKKIWIFLFLKFHDVFQESLTVYQVNRHEQEYIWLTGGNLNCFQGIWALPIWGVSGPPLGP